MTDAAATAHADDAGRFGRQVAALLAADSAHLPTVLDVTALGGRRELVLEAVDGPTLADVVIRRRLTPSESVTVVVSAARAVAALHAAGYCGADLADDELRFDLTGRPVLFGVTALREIIQAGAGGSADDWRAMGALAERLGLLMSARTGGGPLGARQLGLRLALAALGANESAAHLAQLEEALFDVAEPAPVQLTVPGQLSAPVPLSAVSERTSRSVSDARAARSEMRSGAAHRRPSASALVEAFDAGPAALLAAPREQLRQWLATARSRLRGRARVVLAGGAAAVTLIMAAVVLLPDGTPSGAASSASPTASTAPTARDEPDLGAGPSPPHSAPVATASGSGSVVLGGTDPVAATTELLLRRDACLAAAPDERTACLARIADGGASDLDRPARPLGALTPSLIERAGDSALIALTPQHAETAPASALVMRTEAGWRLRQLYEN
ncbi:hypothetical protein ACFOYW_13890 [Gryllotalpicola reticulitermitis]|uniref:Protein kinase domain-containing protein n=1 Tax=Gryllotalpicola reticulitermitis TaxID=1184153 RepID=A0ABV8QAV1_9MICO